MPVQLVMVWLVQQGVSIIPHPASTSHLHNNVAASLSLTMTEQQSDNDDDILRCIAAVLLQ
jgi:diketogulonate reductase-like aldo/keto reductase